MVIVGGGLDQMISSGSLEIIRLGQECFLFKLFDECVEIIHSHTSLTVDGLGVLPQSMGIRVFSGKLGIRSRACGEREDTCPVLRWEWDLDDRHGC